MFRVMFALAFTLSLAMSLAAPSFAANNNLTLEKAERPDTAYTLADLATARLAVYGILDSRYRTPQEDTNLPLSRPEAVRLLWNVFRQEEANGKNKDGRNGKIKAGTVENYSLNLDKKTTADRYLTDIFAEYADAFAWASKTGIARNIPADNSPNVTQREFVSLLLNAMGCGDSYAPDQVMDFAASMGLAPVGLSDSFTLGDTALYLQCAMGLKVKDSDGRPQPVRDRMCIPADPEQMVFPSIIALTPESLEDLEILLREATRFVPEQIKVCGDHFTKDEIYDVYMLHSGEDGETWYLPRMFNDGPWYAWFDGMNIEELAEAFEAEQAQKEQTQPEDAQMEDALTETENAQLEDAQTETDNAQTEDAQTDSTQPEETAERVCDTAREFDGGTAGLYEEWRYCAADSAELQVSTVTENGEMLYVGRAVMFRMNYNEAWELACDADDAFTLYVDDTLSRQADQFYQRFVADARNDKEAVSFAKNAINYRADYAAPVSVDENGFPMYADETHSILGFFRNRQIVCDGYASVFQYLMHRAGLDCVIVIGSTTKADGIVDHAWNKVKVNGEWLNMDVCWSDTGYPYLYDLRTDAFYRGRGHWAETFNYL